LILWELCDILHFPYANIKDIPVLIQRIYLFPETKQNE
jgi:hypothetical protein